MSRRSEREAKRAYRELKQMRKRNHGIKPELWPLSDKLRLVEIATYADDPEDRHQICEPYLQEPETPQQIQRTT